MKSKISIPSKQIDSELDIQLKEVSEFLKDITPQAVKELGGLLSDTFRGWRINNEISIFKKAKEKISGTGLETKQIPLKVLVPIMENSSIEEDPMMQEKWANMLANAATGSQDVSPNYAAILNELSSLEVFILDKIFESVNQECDYQKRKLMQFDKTKIKTMFNLSEEKSDLIIENLFRLNVLQSPGSRGASIGQFPFALRTNEIFELTTLGYEFIKACKWDNVSIGKAL